MGRIIITNKFFLTRILVFSLFAMISFSCENRRFDSDVRQLKAKSSIQRKLRKETSFNITSFSEDTVKNIADSNFKTQIRYTLGIEYIDSNKVFQQKKGIVMFTPNGQSIINSTIVDQ